MRQASGIGVNAALPRWFLQIIAALAAATAEIGCADGLWRCAGAGAASRVTPPLGVASAGNGLRRCAQTNRDADGLPNAADAAN